MALSMPKFTSMRIVTLISTAMGILQCVVSSIFLAGVRKMKDDPRFKSWCLVHKEVEYDKYICELTDTWAILGISTVVVGGIQTVLGLTGIKIVDKHWKIWCGVHVMIFMALITSFSLAVETNVGDELVGKILSKEVIVSKGKAQGFLAFTALNFIFFLPALCFIMFFARKNTVHT